MRAIVCGVTLAALSSVCAAGDARVIRLAGPEPVVGAPVDSCRPALTGEGGPVAWQVLLVHNRAALVEGSRVAVDNRFPICIVEDVKASDVELSVSFTPIAGRQTPGAVGLWTKADSLTAFYELTIAVIRE